MLAPLRKQQHVFRHLQMMGAGVLSRGEEIDRLQRARIGGVQNRHAVAEHVPDIDVLRLNITCTPSGRPPMSL